MQSIFGNTARKRKKKERDSCYIELFLFYSISQVLCIDNWNFCLVVPTVQDFADAIKGTNKKYTGDDSVDGGLIDSYVAGHAKSQLDESVGLRVGTVFDHQFAYGFVITNQLVQNQNIERCLRRMLSTKESMITEKIQMGMKALPVCT